MSSIPKSVLGAAAAALLLLGACAGSSQDATTTTTTTTTEAPQLLPVDTAYLFSSAEVKVESSQGDFTATELDPIDDSGYDPADEGSLEVSNSDGKGIIVTWDAGTEADVENAFVRVDFGRTPDMQYPDMLHTQCRVTVPTRTPDRIAGSFTCTDLPNFGDSNQTLPSAKGTFTASR